jgi:DNA-binding IclR family transcriptional regulator
MALTRKQNAEAVLAQLRGVGPQTIPDIRADLGMTKREVEDALYLLVRQGQAEYDWPTTVPLTYKATKVAAMREP